MNEVVLKNIETAESALNTKLPSKLREFILNLFDSELELDEQTWIFPIVEQVYTTEENPITTWTNNFRDQWKIPAIVFAHNGVGDYLLVVGEEDKNEPGEQIFQLISGSNALEFYATDIYAAYSGQFHPSDFDHFVTYKLDEKGKLTKQTGLEHFQTEPTGERVFLDEHDRKKSMVEDMIDNEETDKHEEILDMLHELTTQPGYAARAWYKLSDLYFKGFGPIPVNIEQALEYNQRAVELGHAKSMANRAYCYLAGVGLEKDIEKAYELIKAANDSTLGYDGKEKDGLYYEMLLAIKSQYLKEKKKK